MPTLIVDAHERPGDAWRKRYKSLCLHDPVWYDHLPYLPFPDHWPIYTPKDKMGDWLESYARIMELDYWTSRPCKRATWDETKREWTVEVERDGKTLTLRPEATGAGDRHVGLPGDPAFPGAETLQGQAASFERARRRRGLGGQALRRRRLEQLRARHRRRPVGARRRRHDDPALADPGDAVGQMR